MNGQIPPRFNSARFREALLFAARLHANQTRKGTDTPYVSHLLAVASIAIEYGASEDEAVAALLHDAPEDQGGLEVLERIRYLFGNEVAEIVDGCTDAYAHPGEEKPPWGRRKAGYIAHLHDASPSVRLVSAADKLHNARSILMDYRREGEAVFDRFRKGTVFHTLWYYRRLADTFLALDPESHLAQELGRVVSKIEGKVAASRGRDLREQEWVYRELDGLLGEQLAQNARGLAGLFEPRAGEPPNTSSEVSSATATWPKNSPEGQRMAEELVRNLRRDTAGEPDQAADGAGGERP